MTVVIRYVHDEQWFRSIFSCEFTLVTVLGETEGVGGVARNGDILCCTACLGRTRCDLGLSLTKGRLNEPETFLNKVNPDS